MTDYKYECSYCGRLYKTAGRAARHSKVKFGFHTIRTVVKIQFGSIWGVPVYSYEVAK